MIPLGMLGGDQVTLTLVEEAAIAMTARGAEGAVAWERVGHTHALPKVITHYKTPPLLVTTLQKVSYA